MDGFWKFSEEHSELKTMVALVLLLGLVALGKTSKGRMETANADTLQLACHFLAIVTVLGGFALAAYHMLAAPSGNNRLIEESGFILLSGILSGTVFALGGRLAASETIAVDSKWGVLGGAGSGYSVSRPVVLLGVLAAGLVALVAMSYMRGPDKRNDEPKCCGAERGQDTREGN